MDTRLVIALAGFVVGFNNKRRRRWWVKKYRRRYDHIPMLRELRENYPDDFKNYLRMDGDNFDCLLELVRHRITKQDTVMRKSITPEERLAATLRYLATGRSFEDMKFSSGISTSALSKIIPETCKAIYEVLRENYMKLQLWDTAGQERFRKSMVQHYYRNVHAVVIVYDVTKPETFHSISSWIGEVESHGLTRVPRVLVGNKCDRGTPESRLATTYAQRLADKYGMPLFETSALLDSECNTVEAIFMTLAHKLYSEQPLRVAAVEGDHSVGVVTLPRQRRPPATSSDRCGCS